jgi:hypothetical protein
MPLNSIDTIYEATIVPNHSLDAHILSPFPSLTLKLWDVTIERKQSDAKRLMSFIQSSQSILLLLPFLWGGKTRKIIDP